MSDEGILKPYTTDFVRALQQENMATGQAKKVLWLSRHTPLQSQVDGLRRSFGVDVEILHDSRPLGDRGADDVVGRMRSGRFNEVVLVAPTSILDELCRRGINPLWPTMSADRRTFLGFDRVIKIQKKLDEVSPEQCDNHKRILWLSRFAPTERQVAELQRLCGQGVVVDHRDIPNAEATEREFLQGGYQAIVAIVPEAVFERLSALELPLLRSEAIRESDPAKVEFRGAGGQGFRFDRYVWYRIEKVTERL